MKAESNHPSLECLKRAYLLSRKIESKVDAKEWDQVNQLDHQRMIALKQAFKVEIPDYHKDEARVMTEQIITLNQRSNRKTSEYLASLKDEARSTNRNMQAAKTYLENAGLGQE